MAVVMAILGQRNANGLDAFDVTAAERAMQELTRCRSTFAAGYQATPQTIRLSVLDFLGVLDVLAV